MSVYECLAHGKRGSGAGSACPECYADQLAAKGADRKVLRFRRVDGLAAYSTPAPAPTASVPSPAYVSSLPPAAVDASRELAAELGSSVVFAVELAPPAPAPILSVPLVPPSGKRRLGVDPGSARMGIVVTAGDVAPLLVLHRETIEVGAVVPYKRPVKRKRKDGTEHTATHHRVLPPGDPGRLADLVLDIARKHGATEATIERVTYVFGLSSEVATGLLRAAEVGAVVADRLTSHGVKVRRSHVSTARARIVGKANVGDAAVTDALAAQLVNPAELVGPDERDAALLCCLAAMPAIEPRATAPRATSGAPRKRDRDETNRDRYREPARVKARAAAQASVAAEREAAGCACRVGGRHKRTCPLFKAKAGSGGSTGQAPPCPALDRA